MRQEVDINEEKLTGLFRRDVVNVNKKATCSDDNEIRLFEANRAKSLGKKSKDCLFSNILRHSNCYNAV